MASNFSVQEDNIFKLSWSLSELSLYDENTTNDFYINGLPNSEWMIKEIGKDCRIRAIFTLKIYLKFSFQCLTLSNVFSINWTIFIKQIIFSFRLFDFIYDRLAHLEQKLDIFENFLIKDLPKGFQHIDNVDDLLLSRKSWSSLGEEVFIQLHQSYLRSFFLLISLYYFSN